MRFIVAQSKGGVAKTFLCKILCLYAEYYKIMIYFIDADNASNSLQKFFQAIAEKKTEFTKYKVFNLLGHDKKIDRTKFDSFLQMSSSLENMVADFGAASSEQLLYYLKEEQPNGIIEVLKELNIKIIIVMAGGGSAKECIEFYNDASNIPGIADITYVVANEFLGPINGKSVKETCNAHIQIPHAIMDSTGEAQTRWVEMMAKGVTYSDIDKLFIIRKNRINNYLNTIFNQINNL